MSADATLADHSAKRSWLGELTLPRLATQAILLLAVAVAITPVVWAVLSSLKSNETIFAVPMRWLPEILFLEATMFTVGGLIWGMVNAEVRPLRAPAIFPKEDPPPHKRPMRPEDDQLPEDDEIHASST